MGVEDFRPSYTNNGSKQGKKVFHTLPFHLLKEDSRVAIKYHKKRPQFSFLIPETCGVSARQNINRNTLFRKAEFCGNWQMLYQPRLVSYLFYVQARYTLEDNGGFEELKSDSAN
ncbi:hypothetical protein RND81_01G068700 [Saponaria officinalis]|uniref:Uncharacterized protein n=1 Tax=Saponaria officinalis TaxID=3572 RepID=A0AAW1ND74_SAPOF